MREIQVSIQGFATSFRNILNFITCVLFLCTVLLELQLHFSVCFSI